MTAKTIWKYPLEITDLQHIVMPKDAVVLSAGVQDGTICVWAMVDPKVSLTESKAFEIHGTGNPSIEDEEGLRFIGTFVLDLFVWHVFERISW